MTRGRTLAISAAVAVGVALLLVGAAVLVLTNTDWGRGQVRSIALEQLEAATDGEVRIGRLEGNLLRGLRLVDVSIVDAQGRPFVRADTLAAGFSLRGLLRQRLAFQGIRLVNAEVVLDQPPGEEWNWVRIFQIEDDPPVAEPGRPGWGDWLELRDVTLVRSRLVVRTEWEPPADLPPEKQAEALRVALSEDSRENVVPVGPGYQNVMEFRDLDAEFPLIRPAHPDSTAIPIEVARLSGVMLPFRPPAAVVRDLSGSVRFANDSLFFRDVRAVLPGSQIAAEGVYALDAGDLLLRMDGAPLALADMRWLYPPLPEEGGGSLRLTVERRTLVTRIIAEEMALRTGDAEIAGRIDVTLGDSLRLQDTDLRFARVDTDLIRRVAPEVEIPRAGELTGRVILAGTQESMRVDGDVTFVDRVAGRSRVFAQGGVGVGEEVRFSDMRVRLEPLQAELVRAFAPDVPLRGTIVGAIDLTGVPGGALRLDADLSLRDPRAAPSRVRAAGGIDQRGGRTRLQGMEVRLSPLHLAPFREQLPQLPAGGVVSGRILLDGVLEEAVRVDGALALSEPGSGVSRVSARGGVAYADGVRFRDLALRLEPLRLDLLRPQVEQLPAGATLEGPIRLDGSASGLVRVAGDLTLRDPATGVSRLQAEGGVAFADTLLLRDLALRADGVQLDLARPWLPDLPAGAVLNGRARLDGSPFALLAVDADLAVRDPATGESRVTARGGIGVGDEVRLRDLRLGFAPLRLELLRGFVPDLPVGGTLEGTAVVTGSPSTRVGFEADLAHREGGERSRVAGRGEVVTGQAGWAAVDLRLDPLSLVTVGRFAPGAGLRGAVAGRVRAQGDLAALAVDADLQAQDGGSLALRGTLDVASEQPGYDLDLAMQTFDLAAVSARAPAATDLTGTASARGRGVEPATMRATLAADLTGSAVDGVAADEVRLRAAVADGLATVERGVVRIGTALAEVDGSFGLTGARTGELAYRVEVDSLHAFAAWIPGAQQGVPTAAAADTAAAEVPRDVADPRTTELATRSAGVQRTGGVTRVQYPGAEAPNPGPEPIAPPGETPDTAAAAPAPVAVALPADSLAGRLFAQGTLRGNVERFDASGRAEVEALVVQGNAVERGRAEFAVAGVGTDDLAIELDADARGVRAAGFAVDSVDARVRHRGDRYGTGHAVVAARIDDDTDVRLDAEFALALERSEVRLSDAELRLDTVTWRTASPGVIRWGGDAIEVETLELRSDVGGRIALDGRLPQQGSGDLDVTVEGVEIGHLIALLQNDTDATGRLTMDARIRGTQQAPVMDGTVLLQGATLDGRMWPETRAAFSYGARVLEANADLVHGGVQLVRAEARLPIDLALSGVDQRLLDGPLRVDVRADSLPLDIVPALTDQVRDLRGRVVGDVAVSGTFADPSLDGVIDLDLGSFELAATGVRFRDLTGTVRLQDDVLTVDSLVAWSGGPIRVAGTISLPELTEPEFDLAVEGRGAWVIDNGDARLQVDADLEIAGPLASLLVEGEVRTRRGVIYIPELAEFGGGDVVALDDVTTYARVDTLFAAEREGLGAEPGLLDQLRLDLAVVIDRDVWLRSTEGNVEIYTPAEVGPLRVRSAGGLGNLALEGAINTDRGDYEFMGRRFRLTRGAVVFGGEPELNPFIQVAAEHEVRLPAREAFSIRVVLGGTLQDLTVTLESSAQPPISQTDLMSYLAFGREASSLLQLQGSTVSGQGEGSGGLVGNVAALAQQQLGAVAMDQLVNDLERDAAREIGLDVIRITPADLPPELFTGSYIDVLRGTEVEAGRYVTPRWYVAGQARPTLVHPGLRVEYRTPTGFQWVTSWQPRYLPAEPTLRAQDPVQASVFGSFLFREWRF